MKKLLLLILLAIPAIALADIGTGSVQTSASGTPYVAIGSGQARVVNIINDTGTALEVQVGGTGVAIPIASGTGLTLKGLVSLSQLSVRRVDTSTTQVTVKYWFGSE